jgi:hypothetical protein
MFKLQLNRITKQFISYNILYGIDEKPIGKVFCDNPSISGDDCIEIMFPVITNEGNKEYSSLNCSSDGNLFKMTKIINDYIESCNGNPPECHFNNHKEQP